MQVSSCQDYDCVSLSFFFWAFSKFENALNLHLILWKISQQSLFNIFEIDLGGLGQVDQVEAQRWIQGRKYFCLKKPNKQKKRQELIILLSSFWVASFIKCSFFIRFYEYYFTCAVGFLENVSSNGRDFSFPPLSVVSVVMSQNFILRLQSWPICRLQVFFLQSWNKFCKSLITVRSDQLVPSLELLPPCVVSDYLFWVIMA